jgi:hypothetical protein
MSRPMRLRHLLLITLASLLCFGGSFTCRSSSHDDVTPEPKKT